MRQFLVSLFVTFLAVANAQTTVNQPTTITTTQTVIVVSDTVPTLLPQSKESYSHFAWGADIGSSIDLTGQEMTAIDIEASLGYKNNFIRFLGLGAGIRMMLTNSSRAYPVFAMFRSGFSSRNTLCFLELKGGCTFMNLLDNIYQRNLFGGIGIGFTLARGRTFSSHIILAYEFVPMKDSTVDGDIVHFNDIHSASIKIGASF